MEAWERNNRTESQLDACDRSTISAASLMAERKGIQETESTGVI
jgi:hypothetical protein